MLAQVTVVLPVPLPTQWAAAGAALTDAAALLEDVEGAAALAKVLGGSLDAAAVRSPRSARWLPRSAAMPGRRPWQ